MKKFINTIIVAIMITVALATGATAAEKMLQNVDIQTMTTANDKNGREYIRLIVEDQRELNGLKYTVGTPVMVFGNLVDEYKTKLTKAKKLSAIVSQNEWQGRTSYVLIKML